MCNSIYTPSWIQDWYREDERILSKRQTVFFTSVDPMNKEHKDPDAIDLEAPRLAWYKQETWKKHQYTVYWVDIKLAQKKGLKFYQTRSKASSFTTHSQLIVSRRLSGWKLEKSYTRRYMRHLGLLRRFPLKTIGWKNWIQKLLEVVKTPQQTQPKSKTQLSSTGRRRSNKNGETC